MARRILRTELCDLLDIEYPVILAGMGGGGRATPPKLVAAVSNAGGLGVAGFSGLSPQECRRRIREIRSLTDRPFGADLLMPATMAEVQESHTELKKALPYEYPQHVAFTQELKRKFGVPDVEAQKDVVLSPALIRAQVEVILEERVPVLAAGLGDPSWVVPQAHARGMKVIGLVGSVRNARRQREAGVDIIVAQGHEAGGHTGRIATLPLVPQVVDAVAPVPVVAAGGIADGRTLAAVLALGAVGAWCGTAFLLAEESDLLPEHQEQILRGESQDFVVTRAYTGKTARDYKNPVIDEWERSGLPFLPMPLQGLLMEDFVAGAERIGRPDLINNPSGQIAGMLDRKRPAPEILEEMVEGACRVLGEILPQHVMVGMA